MRVARDPVQCLGAAPEVVHYRDPIEGFRGYLAVSGSSHRLAAGGLRVQRGVTETTIVGLADAMTLKERFLGLAVDGAKAGMDYDPQWPRKEEALRRFLGFLRPHLLGRLSLGPDMGTSWAEIEHAARQIGIASVKGAVAKAQDLKQEDFRRRLSLLELDVDGATLGERRAGHALGHATLEAVAAAGISGPPRVGIHGFGTLGRGAAMALTEAGITPVAVTDEHTGLRWHRQGGAVEAEVIEPRRFFELPLDVVVLASREDALSAEQAAKLEVAAVVVGANLGLSASVEGLLHRRGVLVVPDFVGGCGGSASMDALFGPPRCPSAPDVLDRVGYRIRALVATMFERARQTACTPRQAALAMSAETQVVSRKPYGHWPGPGSQHSAGPTERASR